MLDLSKLDKGQLVLKMQQAEVVSFLHYLVQSFESYAAGRGIQLHFLKETDRIEMDFDPDQLTKVMSNLISNAVKYTPEEGQVYVMVDIQSSGDSSQEMFLGSTNNLQSPNTFLRIKVKELLINSDLNISEIAYEVGFRTPVYFTQVFTEMEGMSPSQFRDP